LTQNKKYVQSLNALNH